MSGEREQAPLGCSQARFSDSGPPGAELDSRAMAASDDLSTLLSRVALHDRAAFKRVYELTSAHLFGVALRILNRREAAEDVLQEAYVNVWNAAGSYSAAVAQPYPSAQASAWTYSPV